MSLDVIFWTQIGSVLAFVVTIFSLYRLLVDQKDSTIQLLREKVEFLKDKLETAEKSTPDILAKTLNDRARLLEQELEFLSKDKSHNIDTIHAKEIELSSAREKIEGLLSQVEMARDLLNDFTCPHCGAPMSRRNFGSESVEYNGHDYDVDHEFSEYECGYSMLDGAQRSPCRRKNCMAAQRA